MASDSSGERLERGERRSGTRRLVEGLLEERREMLVLYERAAGVAPYPDGGEGDEALPRFVELLVDYMAAGHFGLYQRIAEGRERRRAVRELAAELYPAIAATTDAAMAFNEAFERSARGGDPDETLRERLAALGEALARRIELEDRLIAALVPPAPAGDR